MGNNTFFQAICRTRRVIGSFSSMAIVFSLAIITGHFGIAEAAAPPAPTNLTATMASSCQINLTWTDNATTETNYYVQRSPNGSSSWTTIATLGTNVTSYQNTGLTQNTRYYYRVRCKAGSTYSSYSATANALTASLAAPTGLSTAVASATQITLSWTDNTTYETQYSIERSPNGSSSWIVLGTVATNVTSYHITGLTAGTAYYYRVRAYDSRNYSAYSNTASQTIRTIAASAGANGTIAPSGTVGVANGGIQVFTMTPNSGYKIASVTVDGSAVATNPTYTFTNVTAPHTISATYSVNTVTVTASTGPNGTISPSGSIAVSYGANQSFTITPNPDYHISDVSVDLVSVGTPSIYTLSSVTLTHSIVASFAINTFTINASAGANGSISPSGAVIVSFGATPTFTATPDQGYRTLDLLVDGASVGSAQTYTFPPVTANHSIAATFTALTYTITSIATRNGLISPNGATVVNYGANQGYKITPLDGYSISSILVDGASVATSGTYTFSIIVSNHTITASFADITPPTGTVVINGGATATNNPAVVLTLAAEDAGIGLSQMQFSNDNVEWSNPVSFATTTTWSLSTGDGTKTIYARFMDNAENWSITTMTNTIILDTAASTIVSSSIQNNSITVPANTSIDVVFNEPLSADSVTADTVFLVIDNGTNQLVPGSVTLSADRKAIVFTPSALLTVGTKYKFTITNAVTDDAGNSLAGPYVLNFTTSFGAKVIMNQSSYTLAAGGYDNISITNSTVTTAGPVTAGTISTTSSTLITQGAISANNIYLYSSTLTHPPATIATTGVVNVTATTSLTIDATSKIDVTARGYLGGYQSGNSSTTGRTLGNTTTGGSVPNNGGSYGGLGGNGSANVVYGDPMNPDEPGSGGGGYNFSGSSYNGGSGGGIITIKAGMFTLNGSILADGGATWGYPLITGGGSGGGIRIDAGTLSGMGTISAKGGAVTGSNGGGAGGGGRIAVYYDTLELPASNISTVGGTGSAGSNNGGAGTVYLKASTNTYGDMIIDNKGVVSGEASSPLNPVGSGLITALTTTSMTNSSASWLPGGLIGLKFNPNISQEQTFTIINNSATTLYINQSEGDLTLAGPIGSVYSGVYTLGNMIVTGKAKVLSTDKIVLIGELIVDGAGTALDTNNNDITADKITLKNGGLITHLPATTTSTYRVLLNATTSFTIDSTSKIDITARGYLGGSRGGNGVVGRTLGNTPSGGSTFASGGSYGGFGSVYSGSVNVVYGDPINPGELGSGGGADYNYPTIFLGGNGGGLLRIKAETLTVNGSILADGGSASSGNGGYSGGGSGGSIRIDAATLSGTGTISAKGGASTNGGGAGGGGRIAVYYDTINLPTSNITATGGTGNSSIRNGRVGTVYLKSSDPVITSPVASTTTNRTPLLIYTVSQASSNITVKVDGISVSKVSGDNLDSLLDGTHTVRVEAISSAGTFVYSAVSFTIDTVAPVISINPVSSPTNTINQAIAGTRENSLPVTVSVNTSAIVGTVNYPTPTTWNCTIAQMIQGNNNITASSIDAAGNSSVALTYIVADTVPPTVTINPVTSPTSLVSQTISGSMENGASITVSTNTSSVLSLVTYPTSTNWSCIISSLSVGVNAITVTATDAAGNQSTVTASITSTSTSAEHITNVAVSSNVLDVSANGAATIFFTIDGAASVHLKVIPEKQGSTGIPIFTASQTCGVAGAYLFTWDGKNIAGQNVPNGVYLFILESVVDGTRTGLYSPTAPTNPAVINCTQGTSFEPFRNEPLQLSCTLSDPAYVTLGMNFQGDAYANMYNRFTTMPPTVCQRKYTGEILACKTLYPPLPAQAPNNNPGTSVVFMNGKAKPGGTFTYAWNGRDDAGGIHSAAGTLISSAQILAINTIITTGLTPVVDNVTIDPYSVTLPFGEVVTIGYSLSRDAVVTIRLIAPSGVSVTLLSGQQQTAGAQSITWNGLTAGDSTMKNIAVSETGYYSVEISASDPASGSTASVRRTLRIDL